MVDVKAIACFPTLIHDFTLDLDNDKMLDYVYEMNIFGLKVTNRKTKPVFFFN